MKGSIYEALKSEQTSRINFRDAALYLQLTASTTAVGIYLEFQRDAVLLLVCLSAAFFAVLYFINDFYVSRIGIYLRALSEEFSSWEEYHRKGIGYRIQKWLRRVLITGTFVLSPWVALWYLGAILSLGSQLALGAIVAAVTILGWICASLHPQPVLTRTSPVNSSNVHDVVEDVENPNG